MRQFGALYVGPWVVFTTSCPTLRLGPCLRRAGRLQSLPDAHQRPAQSRGQRDRPPLCPLCSLGCSEQPFVGRAFQSFLDVHLGQKFVMKGQHRFHRFLCWAQWGAHRTNYVRGFFRRFVRPKINVPSSAIPASQSVAVSAMVSILAGPSGSLSLLIVSPLSWSSCGSSASSVAASATPFVVARLHAPHRAVKTKPAVPKREPPAWCRLRRRGASLNDAPHAVVPP
jgi:hypothetical protein